MRLVNSALDLNDGGKMHSFMSWLDNEIFTGSGSLLPRRPGSSPKTNDIENFRVKQPIQFWDFTEEKNENYAGFGFKNIEKIGKNDEIMMMSV